MTQEYASNTPAEHKDRWQTPDAIFAAMDLEFGFYLDAAAEHRNALCARYITEQQNALTNDWVSYGAIWVNPPYSKIEPWIRKAAEQCQQQMLPVVMLLPADTSTRWFSLALETVDEVRFVTDGRINFINSATGREGKNGPGKGSLFMIWRPFAAPRRIFTTVPRDQLIATGNRILSGTEEAA